MGLVWSWFNTTYHSKSYYSGVKITTARIERRKHQYLYKDDLGFHFMDNNNFEQISLSEDLINAPQFLKESQEVEIIFHDEGMDVEDIFKGPDELLTGLYRAPHYSMRHVSSAGLFVPEELIAIPETEAVPGNGQVSFKRTINYGPLTG